jgi:hypothetical protein
MAWTEARPERRLRSWLRGSEAPSLSAQLFMALAMLVCGGVLAGLVFVGIWRHSATVATRARTAQLNDRQRLDAAETSLATLKTELAHTRALLSGVERDNQKLSTALAAERSARSAISRVLTLRLQTVIEGAGAVARQTAALASELSALQAYAMHPGAAGLDAAYLETQARYLATSAGTTTASATALARRAQAAAATVGPTSH